MVSSHGWQLAVEVVICGQGQLHLDEGNPTKNGVEICEGNPCICTYINSCNTLYNVPILTLIIHTHMCYFVIVLFAFTSPCVFIVYLDLYSQILND